MRDIIEIAKERLPYRFDIVLAGQKFNMEVMHNKTADLFTITLRKNKEVLVYNEPLIYGVELYECFDISVQNPDSKYFLNFFLIEG